MLQIDMVSMLLYRGLKLALLAVVILAAGKGQRMQSSLPKVLHPVAGWPMLRHVMNTAIQLKPSQLAVVVGPNMQNVADVAFPWPTVIQDKQLGTGHAVQVGLSALQNIANHDVLVLYGDCPLVTAETLENMRRIFDQAQGQQQPVGLVVLGMRMINPTGYGRLVIDNGLLKEIVEERDTTSDQKKIDLCNSGIMMVRGTLLPQLLGLLTNANAQNEYYLTDIVKLANQQGQRAVVVATEATEVLGVNSRAELAHVNQLMQKRLHQQVMQKGVTLLDPNTVWLNADVKMAHDVLIHPFVHIGPAVVIEEGVEIRPFSVLEGVRVGRFAKIGPFARIRPGTEIQEQAHIGNFVEIKNSTVGKGAKINHLSYVGDATIGQSVNIGAGTITCNYDGVNKYPTIIEDESFIGSNTSLVAPIVVGKGAIVGAGSVITQNVPADSIAVARSSQINKLGRATKYRLEKQQSKEKK